MEAKIKYKSLTINHNVTSSIGDNLPGNDIIMQIFLKNDFFSSLSS